MTFLYQLFGPVMKFIYSFVGHYGWSIVVFSLFAKIITLPLTIKQTRSMQIMKVIQPLQEQIQKKYANNKEKQNAETVKLYKKYNFSPTAGCLPLLIQLPIMIGLYGVLRSPDLYVFTAEQYQQVLQQGFLWIKNLSISPIELFKTTGFGMEAILSCIIPVISIGLTVLQQIQSQQSGPNSPQMMMWVMTAFIGYITFTLNQGIAIYWTLNTGITIVQNLIMNKYFPPEIELPPKEVSHKKSGGRK